MRNSLIAGVAAAVLSAAAIVHSAHAGQQPAKPSLVVETLKPPAAGDATAVQMTSSGGKTLLSWLERAGKNTSLKFAERLPTG